MSDRIATVEDLVAAREARGLGADDIMRQLKVAPRQLAALESGDWGALPGQAFVRGVLRGYGRLLGVDVEPLIESMMASVRAADLRPAASLDQPLPTRSMLGFGSGGSGSRLAWLVLVLVGLLALALFFGGANLGGISSWLKSDASSESVTTTTTSGTTTETVSIGTLPSSTAQDAAAPVVPAATLPLGPLQPSTPPASPAAPTAGAPAPGQVSSALSAAGPSAIGQSATLSSQTGSAPAGEAAAEAAAPASVNAASSSAGEGNSPAQAQAADDPGASVAPVLRLRFDAESWVEARRDGKVLFSGTQQPGSSRELAIDGRTSLVIGNAARVHAEFDGKPLALAPHVRGTVARLTLP